MHYTCMTIRFNINNEVKISLDNRLRTRYNRFIKNEIGN